MCLAWLDPEECWWADGVRRRTRGSRRKWRGKGKRTVIVPGSRWASTAGKQLRHMEGGVLKVTRTDVMGKDGMLVVWRASRDVRTGRNYRVHS